MKNLGYFLVMAGFLGGAFATSLDVQNVDWTLFGVTAAAGIIGLIIYKQQVSAMARSESVLETNRVAERRELRRTQYYPVNRSWRYGRTVALSANDPNAWLRDDDFPPGFFDPPNNDRLMVVAFDVTKDGNMANCLVAQPSGFADFDAKVCALIEERAKLVAPLFPEERSGRYTISRERRPSERLHR